VGGFHVRHPAAKYEEGRAAPFTANAMKNPRERGHWRCSGKALDMKPAAGSRSWISNEIENCRSCCTTR